MTAIYTLDEIATELFGFESSGEFDSDTLPKAEAALDRTQNGIDAFLGDNTGYAQRTEVLSAGEPEHRQQLLPHESVSRDTDVLVLRYRPVEASTMSVRVNDEKQEFTADHAVSSDDYQLDSVVDGWSSCGILRRLSGKWPLSPGGVQVTYYSGLDAVNSPTDWKRIRLAFLEEFRFQYGRILSFKEIADEGSLGQISSESIGKVSRSIDNSMVKKAVDGTVSSVNGVICDAAYRQLEPLINYGAMV